MRFEQRKITWTGCFFGFALNFDFQPMALLILNHNWNSELVQNREF